MQQLDARGVQGRVEVPPTLDYGETAYLAQHVQLARGWLRQADRRRNAVFFDQTLTDATYGRWLTDNGVQWVALSRHRPAGVGQREADVVRSEPAYLTQVWQDADWELYRVAGEPVLVQGGQLDAATATTVRFTAAAAGDVVVRVNHTRWLTVSGGACLSPAGRWTRVAVPRAGTYTVSSSVLAPLRGC